MNERVLVLVLVFPRTCAAAVCVSECVCPSVRGDLRWDVPQPAFLSSTGVSAACFAVIFASIDGATGTMAAVNVAVALTLMPVSLCLGFTAATISFTAWNITVPLLLNGFGLDLAPTRTCASDRANAPQRARLLT